MSEVATGTLLRLTQRPFTIGLQECLVLAELRSTGLTTSLWIDGTQVASDTTPLAGEDAGRVHQLAATLAGGRALTVEAGQVGWGQIGIRALVDGVPVHDSHPGRDFAAPRPLVPQARPAIDLGKLRRNRVPLLVDLATGLLFFVLAKLTTLELAAVVGAGVGLALLAAQKLSRVDLLGGLALFGVAMLLVSALFAIAFENDALIKQRSTIVGLIGAACFLGDGLLLHGRRLGRGLNRYLAYTDVDERRLAIGMGLAGAALAFANAAVVAHASTDTWLLYTTFGDIPLSMALVVLAIRWARRGPGARQAAP